MNRTHSFARLALTSALATVALAGCTTAGGQRADVAASNARTAIEAGKSSAAIASAESAVQQESRNAQYRAMLGAAYLDAGRFASAATSFDDALSLGDTSPRTALGYALALIGKGDDRAALGVLEDWRDDISPADRGLALALAGDTDRGVHVLASALRGGDNTAKTRQNLAYAYALQGNWRAARLMAAEDVAGDMLDARLAEWARTATHGAHQERVAGLLGVPVTGDAGQPAHLALNIAPVSEQRFAEAAAIGELAPVGVPAYAPTAQAAPVARELPPMAAVAPPQPASTGFVDTYPEVSDVAPVVAKPADFEQAFATPAPQGATVAQIARNAIEFVADPVVQTMPVRNGAEPSRKPIAAAPAPSAGGSHLVQLGSFLSEAGAKRAWGIYASRYSQLSNHQMVITKARVRGKTYYRVSAAGFDNAGARSMCSSVQGSGHGCIAWAKSSPLPGAIADTGVRMARRD